MTMDKLELSESISMNLISSCLNLKVDDVIYSNLVLNDIDKINMNKLIEPNYK
jgi:hypothetical protein